MGSEASRSFCRRSRREMAPFSFLLAIARYVQRSSAAFRSPFSTAFAQLACLETINCHASENEKRQKLERRDLRRRRPYYLLRSTDASLLCRAVRYFRCNCRFETAWFALEDVVHAKDCVTAKINLTITYCPELSIYMYIQVCTRAGYSAGTSIDRHSDPRYSLLELYTRLQNPLWIRGITLNTVKLSWELRWRSEIRSFIFPPPPPLC